MKKIWMVIALAFLILIPMTAHAETDSESEAGWTYGWKCEEKTKIDDDTYYMVCELHVTATNMTIDHIEGNFILENNELEVVETQGNWVNDNSEDPLSLNYSFTNTAGGETGDVYIARFIFVGPTSAKECAANIQPTLTREVTTEEEEETPVCEYDPDSDTYYDSEGNVVSKDDYYADETCNPIASTTIVCKESDGVYYDKNGNVTTEQGMYDSCYSLTCQVYDGKYFDKEGNITDKGSFYESCDNYTCTVVDDEYYFDSKGNLVSKAEMMSDCTTTTVEETNTTTPTTTTTVENPKTGINYGYAVLPIGLCGMFGISRFARKNTKIYKI